MWGKTAPANGLRAQDLVSWAVTLKLTVVISGERPASKAGCSCWISTATDVSLLLSQS